MGADVEFFVGFLEASCQWASSAKTGSSSSSPSPEMGLIKSVRLNSAQGSKSVEINDYISETVLVLRSATR